MNENGTWKDNAPTKEEWKKAAGDAATTAAIFYGTYYFLRQGDARYRWFGGYFAEADALWALRIADKRNAKIRRIVGHHEDIIAAGDEVSKRQERKLKRAQKRAATQVKRATFWNKGSNKRADKYAKRQNRWVELLNDFEQTERAEKRTAKVTKAEAMRSDLNVWLDEAAAVAALVPESDEKVKVNEEYLSKAFLGGQTIYDETDLNILLGAIEINDKSLKRYIDKYFETSKAQGRDKALEKLTLRAVLKALATTHINKDTAVVKKSKSLIEDVLQGGDEPLARSVYKSVNGNMQQMLAWNVRYVPTWRPSDDTVEVVVDNVVYARVKGRTTPVGWIVPNDWTHRMEATLVAMWSALHEEDLIDVDGHGDLVGLGIVDAASARRVQADYQLDLAVVEFHRERAKADA